MRAPGVPPGAARRHYSYSHYASQSVAEGFDALRFSGPIGRYLLETQAVLLRDALTGAGGMQVLDVGTGTGRAAIALAEAGADVTAVDASDEMLAVAARRAAESRVRIHFERADAHALPLPDRSVDLAVSLRVLMHVPDWPRCLAELCRVSRHSVVVDFPAALSLAALESTARRAGLVFGVRTEAYRVMAERTVARALSAQGFRVVRVHRQFVLPIALHKVVGSLAFTRGLEAALAALGLRRLLGSPVTMVAER
jgi:ubiquinone/menaquinone biosynthesis C-methylase UbiE